MLTSRNWGEMKRWGVLWNTQVIIPCLCNCVCVHVCVCMRAFILSFSIILPYEEEELCRVLPLSRRATPAVSVHGLGLCANTGDWEETTLRFRGEIQYCLLTCPARGTNVHNYSSEPHRLLRVLALYEAGSLSASMAFAVFSGSVLGVEPLVLSQEFSHKSQEITWPLGQPFWSSN